MRELPGMDQILKEIPRGNKKGASKTSFHKKPFDEATLEKLEIFQQYAKEWLPVFLAPRSTWPKELHIFDFFAGPGKSGNNEWGTPLLVLDEIKRTTLNQANTYGWQTRKIHLHLFDRKASNIAKLKENTEQFLNDQWADLNYPAPEIHIAPISFPDSLFAHNAILQNPDFAKYLLLDQFGVSLITPDILKSLASYPATDIIMFMASNFFNRFSQHVITQSFGIDGGLPKHKIHNEVFNKLKSFDTGAKKYMAPFSLKKESSNIYGIIFLSSAWQGIDKFLKICWDMDQQNGEANYFIEDDDKGGILPGIDPSVAPFSKTERFKKDLSEKLSAGDFKNEHELAEFCYDCCMRPMHCSAILKRLKKEGIIEAAFHSPQMSQEPPRKISIKKNQQLTLGF